MSINYQQQKMWPVNRSFGAYEVCVNLSGDLL